MTIAALSFLLGVLYCIVVQWLLAAAFACEDAEKMLGRECSRPFMVVRLACNSVALVMCTAAAVACVYVLIRSLAHGS